jgi:small multidrug resistance family-3 protein
VRIVDGEDLSIFDWTGAGIALFGMGVIVSGWATKE